MEMHRQVVYPDDLDLLLVELELLSTGRKVFHNLHYRWMGKNHETIWINCRGRVLSDPEDGSPRYLVGCINEIGAKQKADNVSGLLGEYSLKIFMRAAVQSCHRDFCSESASMISRTSTRATATNTEIIF